MNNNKNDKVKEYFYPDIKQWDVTKIQQTFHEVDVRCILQTRIPQIQVQDRVAWMHIVDDCYTTKFGYHYWYEKHYNHEAHVDLKGWKRLWKLPIPHKMKYFI